MNTLPVVAETPQPPMHAAALARDPAENTAAALSSLQRSGCSIALRTRTEFPESGSWREVITGAAVEISEGADLAACRRMIAAMMAPASLADTAKWLAVLSLKTARKSTGENESEALIAVYYDDLRNYPGDIVRETLKGWRGKWFPTWGELADILDGRVAARRAIEQAFRAKMNPPAPLAIEAPKDASARLQHILNLEHRASQLRINQPAPEDRGCAPHDRRQRAEDLEEEAYNLKRELKSVSA